MEIPTPTYSQGDILTACVKSNTTYFHIRDIQEAQLTQDHGDDGIIENSDNIIVYYEPDLFTSKECSLGLCKIDTMIKTRYFDILNPGRIVLRGMAVCDFGGSMALAAGCPVDKLPVGEDSDWANYPIVARINDRDDSESWESIVISYKTENAAADLPEIRFLAVPEQVEVQYEPGKVTVTSESTTDALITDTLKTLQIKPNDGEDILYTVNATIIDIYGRRRSVTEECRIPVETSVETSLRLNALEDTIGDEGSVIPLGVELTVSDRIYDFIPVDAEVYLEVKPVDSSITLTSFWVGPTEGRSVVLPNSDGWAQVSPELVSSLGVRGQSDFSGRFSLLVRATVIVDQGNVQGTVYQSGDLQILVTVRPVADGTDTSTALVIALEDAGPIPFGAKLSLGGMI